MKEWPEDSAVFPPGTSAADAKEYLFHHIAALKLAEKSLEEAEAALRKWQDRVELARSKGETALVPEAEREAARWGERRDSLLPETNRLREQIAALRRQLPGVAARERSIDPDLLEQELRIALGETPGDGPTRASTERRFGELDAGAALESLKLRMGVVRMDQTRPDRAAGGETGTNGENRSGEDPS